MEPRNAYNQGFELLETHHKWFSESLPLIASENIPSSAVREAILSDFGNRYELTREKGFAKPVDIANHLHVTPPTVTGMLDRLRREQLVVHEKYSGIALTGKGQSMAVELGERHVLLVDFLKLFGVEEVVAQKDTEGLEHNIGSGTLDVISRFVEYAKSNPQWWNQFRKQTKS